MDRIQRMNFERKVLVRSHLKDIETRFPGAHIIPGDFGWPVITFESEGEIYYYDRDADAFTTSVADASHGTSAVKESKPRDLSAVPSTATLNKYGITAEEYLKVFANQDGKCAICQFGPKTRRLNIDHCHRTGKFRGLLCYSCNYGLGVFKDKIASLERAAEYLKRAKQ